MNESPAPTVSTTSTGTPGRLTGPLAAPAARAPSAAASDHHQRRTVRQPGGRDLVDRPAGLQPRHVLVAGLHHVRDREQLVHDGQHLVARAHQQLPHVRVERHGGRRGGARGEPAQHGTARRRGDAQRPDVQGGHAVDGVGRARRRSTASRRSRRPGSRTPPIRPAARPRSPATTARWPLTAWVRSTPLVSRWARSRRPRTSSESRASIRAGTPSLARPTATLAGLPPAAAWK